jgi:hypothetical protein
VPDRDGLYILDFDCNETYINSVDAKRCKLSDDNTMYTWYCRLGHVGIKRMKKLHCDGLLGSLDFESFDTLLGTQLGTPRGRYDEHNSKSSLSIKPRFIEPVGERTNF